VLRRETRIIRITPSQRCRDARPTNQAPAWHASSRPQADLQAVVDETVQPLHDSP